MNLKNKVVVITGASKGLGKALASAFLSKQAKVIISARAGKELRTVAQELGIPSCPADVTRESDLIKLAAFATKKLGRLDIWVNNAGITLPHANIEDVDVKRAHEVMEVNFFGTFYGSRVALKIMKKQKFGTIVNIVSRGSLTGRPHSALYSSTKWAARGLTESLRLALAPYGISVIAIHPGGIKTDLFKNFKPAGYGTWMEPSYVAEKIIKNLQRVKPKIEMLISQKN